MFLNLKNHKIDVLRHVTFYDNQFPHDHSHDTEINHTYISLSTPQIRFGLMVILTYKVLMITPKV